MLGEQLLVVGEDFMSEVHAGGRLSKESTLPGLPREGVDELHSQSGLWFDDALEGIGFSRGEAVKTFEGDEDLVGAHSK